jgi:hypothetical protein
VQSYCATGAAPAKILDADAKSEGGADPLAVYKPIGAKAVGTAKAMGIFNGGTHAAAGSMAAEVSLSLCLGALVWWPGESCAANAFGESRSADHFVGKPRGESEARQGAVAFQRLEMIERFRRAVYSAGRDPNFRLFSIRLTAIA